MPRYTLIQFDRYDATHSDIILHDTSLTDLKKAFKEALIELWGDGDFKHEWKEIKQDGTKIGLDFEEESYLFWES